MTTNKTWLQTLGAVALAIGISSATMGATLAAFAASEDQQGGRAAHAYLAGLDRQQVRPA